MKTLIVMPTFPSTDVSELGRGDDNMNKCCIDSRKNNDVYTRNVTYDGSTYKSDLTCFHEP